MRLATIRVTGNDARLNTLRLNRGVVGALEYLMAQPPSGAFGKLIAAGCPDETAEAIIARHPSISVLMRSPKLGSASTRSIGHAG